MILTCPECKSRYVVSPNALLPHGRTVRCAKCKHNWFEKKPEENVEIVPPQNLEEDVSPDSSSEPTENPENEVSNDIADESTDFDFPISKPRKRKRPIAKSSNLPALQNQKYGSSKMGWISLVVFITALISLFLIFQEFISTNLPASKRLYTAVGLDQVQSTNDPEKPIEEPLEDRLKIGPLEISRANIRNVDNLIIKGYVENISGGNQVLPELKITLLNEQRRAIREWTFKAIKSQAAPEEQVTFETSLPNPPATARDVSVIFATN
ncbi:MAG: zinc-ribbon domain-containing protein [Emcibacteraceae bacterium]|nr:zinc-ribbon domain-containing protein [Emcibacteraceae bacterium]MDG1997502.1 zinc-ribbon domain-containing protein [Emcibacteraceae bacterium]